MMPAHAIELDNFVADASGAIPNDGTILIAARIYSTDTSKYFDFLYRIKSGKYARYACTSRRDSEEYWSIYNSEQAESWFAEKPSNVVIVRPDLALRNSVLPEMAVAHEHPAFVI